MLHLDKSVQTFRYSKFNLEENSLNDWQELFDEFSETILESGDVMVLKADNATDVKFIGSVLETLN